MLAEERQATIVDLVNTNGSVLVKDLAERFGVTEDCIRKDLTILQKKELLKKTYGGAVQIRVHNEDYFAFQRMGKNQEEKIKIAKKAIGVIRSGNVIFLDNSTSNVELARLLIVSDLNVTVVTNMIEVMRVFAAADSSIKLIFVGGTFSKGKDSFSGALTNMLLRNFRFDKSFLGVVGVDLDRNCVTTFMSEDATTKKTILDCSTQSYMMLESRKLSSDGNFVFAEIEDFTGAVLEKEVQEKDKAKMEKYQIEWIM